jgi:endo-1,4-beta-xylanase
MDKMKYVKVLCCGLLLLSCGFAKADWNGVQSGLSQSQTRSTFDRVNRVLFVYVDIKNTSEETLVGPFRVLIDDATIPVVNNDGLTDTGVPYFMGDEEQLLSGETLRVRVD